MTTATDVVPGEVSRQMGTRFSSPKRFVAYFSMEIALENAMPSYSGGLGVLAGDTVRAAADIRLPMVAVSLLYRKGYFSQRLAEDGTQTEDPVEWFRGLVLPSLCLGLLGARHFTELDKSYLHAATSTSLPGVFSAFPLLEIEPYRY